jgi:hypothetical protein
LYLHRHSRRETLPNVSLPKRLLAKSFALSPHGLRNAINKQLAEDLRLVDEVSAGKKCLQELVNVTVLDGVSDQVTEKLKEVSNYVADTILTRCLVELTQSLII